MNHILMIAMLSAITIMVSIITYIQVLPLAQQWQEETISKEKMLEKNQCVDEARAEKNFTQWSDCLIE